MDNRPPTQLTSRSRVQAYYSLTKPGIIRGNALTAAAGFFLAVHGRFDVGLFLAMLAGLSLVIAAGCVCNNFIDRGIDRKMARTRHRALVSGAISGSSALLFAAVLGAAGTVILLLLTNLLTTSLAVFGFIAYVVIYGAAKRRSVHGTVVGSLSGAVPPVVGYCAVTGRLDLGALLIFLILVFWQMPHFYAIALYRLSDYKAAGIPVLPLVRGRQETKLQITAYIVAYIAAVAALTVFGYSGYVYLAVSLPIGLLWLVLAVRGFRHQDEAVDVLWARKMFGFSLIAISLWCLMVAVDSFLHTT